MHKKPVVIATLLFLVTLSFARVAQSAGTRVSDLQSESQAVGPGNPGSIPILAQQEQGPTDPAELEAFLDALMAQDMEEYHIAGAAVSVVKDGKLFFAKGYGYADLEKRIPVDPEQTLFGTGSIGKTFTWTAVMQLVEQGKLDLDADINTYLDFRIPDTYPQPITLKHLMTHTSGFENRLLASAVWDADDLVPARDWLVSNMHARVRPAGEAAGYSNYNAMLAGYIVARVSGRPYEEYIQEHILDPLGMTHSTARLPVPPELRTHTSVGYIYADGAFQPFPGYLAQNAYGFFDFSDNGQRTLGHSGELPPAMQTLLLLLPDQNLGVYVAYNSHGGRNLTNQHMGFHRAFSDQYYTAPAVAPLQPPEDFAARAGRYEGSYRWTMGAKTTLLKTMGFFGTVELRDSGDGTLLLATPYGQWRFVEVEPLYFRQADGPYSLAFREDDQGRITYMFADNMPMFAFERLDWYETRGLQIALALVSVLIFLATIPVVSIRFIRDRRSGDGKAAPRVVRAAYWLILGISALNLLFLVGLAVWGIAPIVLLPVQSLPPAAKIVLGLGVLSAVLTAGALVYAVSAWKNSYWSIAGRAYYTLVTLAAVAFVWFLNYWNLLGWRY